MIRFQSKRQAFLCALSWAFAVACMALIFHFSQQSGVQSQSLSDGVLSKIFDLVGLLIPSAVIRNWRMRRNLRCWRFCCFMRCTAPGGEAGPFWLGD